MRNASSRVAMQHTDGERNGVHLRRNESMSITLTNLAGLTAPLREYKEQYGDGRNPRHPVLRLALDLQASDSLCQEKIQHELAYRALEGRAQRMAAYIGTTNTAENIEKIKGAIGKLAYDKQGRIISADEFAQRLSLYRYNAVFTGHPCFSMNPKQAGALSKYFTHLASGKDPDPAIQQSLHSDTYPAYETPDLKSEIAQSCAAIKNCHKAEDIFMSTLLEIAQETYPDEWDQIDYPSFKFATWIPFDWDGRDDISWNGLMAARIQLQMDMLEIYRDKLDVLRDVLAGHDKASVARLITKIENTLDKLIDHHTFFDTYEQDQNEGFEYLAAEINALCEDTRNRITHPDALIMPLQNILDRDNGHHLSLEAKTQIVRLRSKLNNQGITLAEAHFRINATSVLATLQEKGIIIDPNMPKTNYDGAYGVQVEALLSEARPVHSNLIDTARAEETIYKQMTMIRQIVDHLDSHSPVRFLIAETENAIVPLTALALARELGIEDHIHISPLFEDRGGIDAAEKIVKTLYANKDYRAYIEKRGVAAFQIGYSDSGRYDGQLPAGAFMELVKGLILKQHKKYGLVHVDVCFFDTHGESPGRGTHSGSLKERIAYNHSGFTIEQARKAGITVRSETSWQGGDGYLWHGTVESSLAILTQTFLHLTKDHSATLKDPYYKSQTRKQALAFWETARAHHSELSDDPRYAALIGMFSGMMPRTGSRPVKRASASGGLRKLPRAIPHNGTLAQLGIQDNVIGGLGYAARENGEVYKTLMMRSEAFAMRMRLAESALRMSSSYIMQSYVELYNPLFWQERARLTQGADKEIYMAVSRHLERGGLYKELSPITRTMIENYEYLKDARLALNLDKDPLKDPVQIAADAKDDLNRQAVHGRRQAAIMDLLCLAVQTPDISNQHDTSREDVIKELMAYHSEPIDVLRNVFRVQHNGSDSAAFHIKKPSGLGRGTTDYHHVKKEIIDPIEDALNRIKEASHLLMHMTPVGVG